MITIEGKYTNAEVMIDEVEDSAYDQIQEMVNHEAFTEPVRIMPDTHWGKGAVIGFTMSVDRDNLKICPATLGVDIGCGMIAVNYGDFSIDDLEEIDESIRDNVPMGFSVHSRGEYHIKNDFPWTIAESKLCDLIDRLDIDTKQRQTQYDRDEYFSGLCQRAGEDMTRAINSMGTLGGGNHFIELSRSENNNDLWCVIHTGSRGIGNKTAQYWINKATELRDMESNYDDIPKRLKRYITRDGEFNKENIRRDFDGKDIQRTFSELGQYRKSRNDRNNDLDYLEDEEAIGYIKDMCFLQTYASENRRQIAQKVSQAVGYDPIEAIESVHNYLDFDDLIIRKGATPARDEKKAVVPLNMKDGTLLVEGKGNDDWNQSVCHGAGRVMSRTEAKDTISEDKVRNEMDDIYTSNIPLDEAPNAYKSATMIQEAIKPTAEVIDILKPIMNIKA